MNDIQKNFRKTMAEHDKSVKGSNHKPYNIPSGLIIVCLIFGWNMFGTRIMEIIPTSITGEYVTELEVHEFLQEHKILMANVNKVANDLTRLEIDDLKRMSQNIDKLSDARKERFEDLTVHTNLIVTSLDKLIWEHSQYLETGKIEHLTRYNEEVVVYNTRVHSQMELIVNLLKNTGMRYTISDEGVRYWYNGHSF